MKTTFSQQIEAIQKVREMVIVDAKLVGASIPNLDAALNDAGSTIAALNLAGITQEMVLAAPRLLTVQRYSVESAGNEDMGHWCTSEKDKDGDWVRWDDIDKLLKGPQ